MIEKGEPLVSIIMPVYNAAHFLPKTIESVLDQSYSNWELILVDDCSGDDSVDIIKAYVEKDERIRLLVNSVNSKAAKTRNAGLAAVRGRYLAYLDADDLWVPHKLRAQVKFMQDKKSIFSYTGYEFVDNDGMRTGKEVRVPEHVSYAAALKRSPVSTITAMFDLSQVSSEDLIMPDYLIGEDTATWWRILKKYGDAQGIDETMSLYRRGTGGTLSSNKLSAAKWRWYIYRQHEKLPLLPAAYYFLHYVKYALERRV